MQTRMIELSVGIFVLLGILALCVLGLKVSGLSLSSVEPSYKLHAYFDNVGGLTVRAKVTMAGVVVGKVTAISLNKTTYRARVDMEIYKQFDNLTEDTSASILTAGLLGEKYIGLSVGGADEMLSEGGEIGETQSAIVLEELIGQFFLNKAKE